MADTRVLIVRNKGQVIPDAYIEKVYAQDPCFMGMALSDNGKLIVSRIAVTEEEGLPSIEDFKGSMEDYKDSTAVYYFVISDLELPEVCQQPYDALVNDKNETTMVVFLEGDYSNFNQPKAVQTDDYFAANTYIIPQLKKLWAAQKMDNEKLLRELNDPLNKITFENSAVTRGICTIVTAGYEPISFEKNVGGSHFPWGYTSATLGYTEEAPKAPTAEAPKRSGFRKAGSSQPVTTRSGAPNKEGPVSETLVKPGTKTDVQAAIEQAKNAVAILIGPPDSMKGNDRRSFFNKYCQFCPNDFFKKGVMAPVKPGVTVPQDCIRSDAPIKSLQDLPKPDKGIVVTSEVVPDTGPKEPLSALPLIPPGIIKRVQEISVVDRNNRSGALDPKQIQALEAEHPDFYEQIGDPAKSIFDDKLFEDFVLLGEIKDGGIQALATLAFTERNRRLAIEEQLTAPADNKTEDDTATPVAATPPAPAASPRRSFRRAGA